MTNSITFIWRCDRCNRPQEGDYDPTAADQPMPAQWSRLVTFKDGQNGALDDNADLCRECTESFRNWLYAPGQAVAA